MRQDTTSKLGDGGKTSSEPAEEIRNHGFGFRRTCDFEPDWHSVRFHYNLESQKGAALAFQIHEVAQRLKRLGRRFEAVGVAVGQRDDFKGFITNRVQHRSTPVSHFGRG